MKYEVFENYLERTVRLLIPLSSSNPHFSSNHNIYIIEYDRAIHTLVKNKASKLSDLERKRKENYL